MTLSNNNYTTDSFFVNSEVILEVNDLSIWFKKGGSILKAVDRVNLKLYKAKTSGLVGESGCGKSITALSLARLLPDYAIYRSGSIKIMGKNILEMKKKEIFKIRGSIISYVFQEPTVSLNPVIRCGKQVEESLKIHRPDIKNTYEEVIKLFSRVGIPNPVRCFFSYPHELSGGMQQRVMIAIAVACNPSILIADEPTTALDVTIQAQILKLLKKLQQETKMALLLITHNIAIIASMTDFVYVMYAGSIVEEGTTENILTSPSHPYTKALIEAIPRLKSEKRYIKPIPGQIPNLRELPAGCKFHPRCPLAKKLCSTEEPQMIAIDRFHKVKCHFYSSGGSL